MSTENTNMEERSTPEREIIKQRMEKLERLRKDAGFNPFVIDKWDKEHKLSFVRSNFSHLGPDEMDEDALIKTAGRVMAIRKHGKASFVHLEDDTDRLQLYFRFDTLNEEYEWFKKWVDTGDYLGIVGHPFRTKRGELSLLVTDFKLLSKALRPLPEKWHGLKDTEVRYRQRYLDLIANPEVREVFRKRAKIIKTFREVLESHGTLEVETPMLSPIAGGATARPFITFHNALGINLYLRIATELYLKRLIVGMYERVYEIGKNFRNEGIDSMHNPEFTAMEVYWAYANYDDMMNLTEEIIVACADAMGSRQLPYGEHMINYEPPFRRATMVDLVKEHCGVDFLNITDEEARRIAKERGLEIKGNESRLLIMTEFFDNFVEDKLIQPTFVLGYPVEISPLAKRDPDNPDFTRRFELFICGAEVANAFSELNDPLDQRERFLDQLKKREAGDEEAHVFDEDFVTALEHGLPPTGGLGIGIDRLTMFLTNSSSIRDVILFPTMRPKE
ncbi:MAG: lysine--tRNA ligase [Acetomicrobium sp.]|uniref:Lysine--tRNA ligase n=1 Tax=Acetomicrobium hydrogeniformans ATCC BAA-1850 TaxID=592015 RepID=A0A0T5X8E7_9BACT|nr:lysine--tRNA ligase [Acetomicrobium hydrogeniformans]KRT34649.1 lysine--tRNA ligase [Acetomicrobium hydrogeniformans ATCC BAA-1850]MBC7322025.1 lysine--tRNA ligase [Acetomicrobium sp.]